MEKLLYRKKYLKGLLLKQLTTVLRIIKEQLSKQLKIWDHCHSHWCYVSTTFFWVQNHMSGYPISYQKHEQNKHEVQSINRLKWKQRKKN